MTKTNTSSCVQQPASDFPRLVGHEQRLQQYNSVKHAQRGHVLLSTPPPASRLLLTLSLRGIFFVPPFIPSFPARSYDRFVVVFGVGIGVGVALACARGVAGLGGCYLPRHRLRPLDAAQKETLQWLLRETFEPEQTSDSSFLSGACTFDTSIIRPVFWYLRGNRGSTAILTPYCCSAYSSIYIYIHGIWDGFFLSFARQRSQNGFFFKQHLRVEVGR